MKRDPSGTVRPKKRADGTVVFQAYGRAGGKKVYIRTCDTEREARQVIEEHRVDQRKIQRGELPAKMDRRRTFASAADKWLEGRDRARSAAEYRARLRRHVLDDLGELPLTSITVDHLEALQEKLLTEPSAAGAMLSRRTVHAVMTAASAVLGFAVARKWLPTNPADGLELCEVAPRAYHWIRTRAEQERLLEVCKDPLRSILATLLLTGMRIDEVIHLQWEDVDLEHRIITIQRGRQGPPKGGRLRYVPINDSLLPVLRRWRLLCGTARGVVFPGQAGRPRAATSVSVPFKRALKRAGIETKLRVHDLRHTYASHFVRDGGDIFRLSKYLGHASVHTTQTFYAHLIPDDYAQDWGRNAIRVPLEGEGAVVLRLAGDGRETGPAPAAKAS
jgi:integrase